jgi:hypothetical protein
VPHLLQAAIGAIELVSGQWSTVNGQHSPSNCASSPPGHCHWSVVSGQWSMVNGQLQAAVGAIELVIEQAHAAIDQ